MSTPKFRFDQMDAAESVFFSRQLEKIRSGSYDTKFAEFQGRKFVPVDNSVDPSEEVITYRQFTEVGYAEWAKDLGRGPRVDLYGTEFSTYVRQVKAAYGYGMDEARKAQRMGMDLPSRKATAARRAIEQKLDQAIWTGKPDGSLLGLLNQSNTTSYTVANGQAGTKTWETKSPDEILLDMYNIEAAIINGTLDIEKPDILLLPLSSYQLIASRRLGDGSDTTILRHFLATAISVTSVERSYKLESATAAYGETSSAFTGKRMVCYNRSPEKLVAIIPQEFNQLAPQVDGFEVVTQCEGKTGGVVMYYPKSLAYGDGI